MVLNSMKAWKYHKKSELRKQTKFQFLGKLDNLLTAISLWRCLPSRRSSNDNYLQVAERTSIRWNASPQVTILACVLILSTLIVVVGSAIFMTCMMIPGTYLLWTVPWTSKALLGFSQRLDIFWQWFGRSRWYAKLISSHYWHGRQIITVYIPQPN